MGCMQQKSSTPRYKNTNNKPLQFHQNVLNSNFVDNRVCQSQKNQDKTRMQIRKLQQEISKNKVKLEYCKKDLKQLQPFKDRKKQQYLKKAQQVIKIKDKIQAIQKRKLNLKQIIDKLEKYDMDINQLGLLQNNYKLLQDTQKIAQALHEQAFKSKETQINIQHIQRMYDQMNFQAPIDEQKLRKLEEQMNQYDQPDPVFSIADQLNSIHSKKYSTKTSFQQQS